MKKISVSILFLSILFPAFSQSKLSLGSSSEYIFSLGHTTTSNGSPVDPVLRFSAWLNAGFVLEERFNNNLALVSGLNIRNVGMINKIDSIKLKHRVYGVGIPLGVRIGNLDKKVSVTLGAEAEFFMNYKVKEYINKDKIYKNNRWFSDDVELFNPSVFAQVQFGKKYYIRMKYYLNNFLKECVAEAGSTAPCGYTLHDKALTVLYGYPKTTQLFYISLGSESLTMRKHKNQKETPPEPKPIRNVRTI